MSACTNVERQAARSAPDDFTALASIDWRAPWFAGFAERGARWQQLAQTAPERFVAALTAEARASGYRTGQGAPLSFMEQDALPDGVAYETHIARTGAVATRHNLHDFFNALVWFAFPRVKAVLNARQAAAIARDGVGGARGTERDAITLFDEGGIVFATCDAELAAALVAFDWQRLFVARREDWGKRCSVWPFGHALLEKLVSPYKACTAHALIVEVAPEFFDWPAQRQLSLLDASLGATLADAVLTSRGFAPLPVLGVPGFWDQNTDPAFYDDPRVFRSGRDRSGRDRSGRAGHGAAC
jgi:hypothetical protein